MLFLAWVGENGSSIDPKDLWIAAQYCSQGQRWQLNRQHCGVTELRNGRILGARHLNFLSTMPFAFVRLGRRVTKVTLFTGYANSR